MLVIRSVAAAVLLTAATAGSASAHLSINDPTPRCKMNDEGVLPAGIYRRATGTYVSFFRERLRCATATHVVVSGIHATVAEAQADVAALPAGLALAPGYPWLEHTDEMALVEGSPSGVAVMLATFATRAQARAWAARHAHPGATIRIHELASEQDTLRRRVGNPKHGLVRIPPGPDVEGLSFQDAEAVVNALGRNRRLTDPDLRQARGVACRVRGGSIFLVAHEELFPLGLGARTFAPVRCEDGRTAYVPWRRTLLESVVWLDRARRAHVSQIVAVVCDEVDAVYDWLYDPAVGRKGRFRRLPLRTGCR